jgi:hypothetical protein
MTAAVPQEEEEEEARSSNLFLCRATGKDPEKILNELNRTAITVRRKPVTS